MTRRLRARIGGSSATKAKPEGARSRNEGPGSRHTLAQIFISVNRLLYGTSFEWGPLAQGKQVERSNALAAMKSSRVGLATVSNSW